MNKRCCGNCEYFERYFGKDDKFGICEIDMTEVVPQSDWCPSWEEKQWAEMKYERKSMKS